MAFYSGNACPWPWGVYLTLKKLLSICTKGCSQPEKNRNFFFKKRKKNTHSKPKSKGSFQNEQWFELWRCHKQERGGEGEGEGQRAIMRWAREESLGSLGYCCWSVLVLCGGGGGGVYCSFFVVSAEESRERFVTYMSIWFAWRYRRSAWRFPQVSLLPSFPCLHGSFNSHDPSLSSCSSSSSPWLFLSFFLLPSRLHPTAVPILDGT